MTPRPPFWADPFWAGRRLLDEGRITAEQFESAVQAHRQGGGGAFADTLIRLNLIRPYHYARLLAELSGLPFLQTLHPQPQAARQLEREQARRYGVIPVERSGGEVTLAVADPVAFGEAQARHCYRDPALTFRFAVAARQDIHAALDQVWSENAAPGQNPQEFLAQTLHRAIDAGASDIHFSPKPRTLAVRFRIDGQLIHHTFVLDGLAPAVVQAVKLAADMNISERRLPQDGKFTRARGSKTYSFRVSAMPSLHGQNLVLRIADDDTNLRTFAELGMSPEQIAVYTALIDQPNGVVVCTGPTGSGKSTLLYSTVVALDTSALNVVSVEDPVEYPLPAITQVAVNNDIGLTFAAALRTILRQDPDVIIVGEIRDLETARITIQAALTGHQCFTTLHTNDAAGAVTRLIDMGIEPFLVASTVKGVLAQRLIRRVCGRCAEPHPQAEELRHRCQLPEARFVHAVGCPECRQTGYHGRLGIFEIFPLHEAGEDREARARNLAVERLIAGMGQEGGATEQALLQLMQERGHPTLRRDGLAKAAAALTTPEEVFANL